VSGVVTYDAVIDVDNKDRTLRPGMTASVTFVLAQVADAVKIPNSALRFKPTKEQQTAMREQFGGGSGGSGRGSGRRGASGSDGTGGGSGGSGGGRRPDAATSASSTAVGSKRDFGDKKPVYKLEDGKPKMVLVKPGLTDGSSTEMLEGDLKPGDLLITEISGVAAAPRKVGAF
jgi:HlyD family secretion protein